MSSASASSSTPSSVSLHSDIQSDYHLIFAYPPPFATQPYLWYSLAAPECGLNVQYSATARELISLHNSRALPDRDELVRRNTLDQFLVPVWPADQ